MKSHPLLRQSLALNAMIGLGASAPAAFADTISPSVDLRVLSPNPNINDSGALSLYNDGGNIQRSFLQFDLSGYSGKSITSDATLTLVAGIFGNSLTGVSIGTANSAWTQGGATPITWNNQPGITPIPGATNPNGTFGSGPVTWTIPWYMLEKMATNGSGYNNGLGITSGVSSTQHFQSTGSGTAPTLTFSAATGAGSTWTGGNGNWTDTANWAGGTVAEGIGQAATINGGSAVDITMDANRSVGSLSFSGSDHTISGAGKLALNVVSGSPTVSVEATRTATISAALIGLDGLTKTDSGDLILSGANTYSGTTTVSAGRISLAAAGSLPTAGQVSLPAGGILSNDAAAGTSFNLGALTMTGGELAATSSPGTSLGNFHLSGDVTVSGSVRSTISADVRVISNQTRNFNVGSTGDASGVDLLITGRLGHQNNVAWGYATKSGEGTMKLTGINELGSMTVNAGRLILEDTATGWGHQAGGLNNNAELEYSVTSGSGGNNGSHGGSGNLSKTGVGTLTLSGGLNYSGTTTVAGGTLNMQGSGGGGTNYNGGNIHIHGASTLRVSGLRYNFNGETFTFNSVGGGTIDAIASGAGGFVFTGNNSFVTSGGAQNIISGTRNANEGFNLNGRTATFNVATGTDATSDLEVVGTIWNGGSVIKNGVGRLEFSAPQQYSGDTTVNEGTLILGDGSNNIGLSNSHDVVVESGATLQLSYEAGNPDTIDELRLGGVQMSPGTYNAANSDGFITGTGSLIVQNGPIADPFANWMATNYPTLVSPDNQPGADPDDDGIANLLEYVLEGGDPSVSSADILPTLDASGANFVFTYLRRAAATGTTQTFQYGTDLSGWTDVAIPGGAGVVVTDLGGGIDEVEITVAKGVNSKLFGRLQVSQP